MGRLERLIRYYGVGAVNTAFGFGLYSLLVFLGLNLFLAQFGATVCGVAFNYFTYSRHVFTGHRRNPMAFVAAYAFNYLMGLGLLALIHVVVKNPYAAGFLGLLIGTAINYFVLRRFVFRPPEPPHTRPS
jgi:putative flippase GtrA